MSRRPRQPFERRVARSLTTMAPGGRLASESPVRRSRAHMAGATPAVYVGGYVGATSHISSPSGATEYASHETRQVKTQDLMFATPVWSEAYETAQLVTPAAGDGLLVVSFADTGFSLTPPDGWTTLGTGTHGRLTWYAHWVIHGETADYVFVRNAPRPSLQDQAIFMQMLLFRPEDGSGGVITPPSVDVATHTGSEYSLRQGGTFTKQMTWLALSMVANVPPNNAIPTPTDPAGDYGLPIYGVDLTDLEVYCQYGPGHTLTGAQTLDFICYEPESFPGIPDETVQWVDLAIGWPL